MFNKGLHTVMFAPSLLEEAYSLCFVRIVCVERGLHTVLRMRFDGAGADVTEHGCLTMVATTPAATDAGHMVTTASGLDEAAAASALKQHLAANGKA